MHRRNIRLDVIEIALRLATARRNARRSDADPLQPVRSLHYFLPVIDELPPGPPPDGYLDYLRNVVPDNQPASGPVMPTTLRRSHRPRRHAPRQLRLPFDVGAGPKNDTSW